MNKDLTVGKPERVLWRYCIPLLGSVIFQQLYNIADSLVAGKYVGKNALAAVGNSYEITLIYMAFAFGCNMGCSVIAAQFFGAEELPEDEDDRLYDIYIFGSAVSDSDTNRTFCRRRIAASDTHAGRYICRFQAVSGRVYRRTCIFVLL
mgnify:CR=1 FL=1